jgi:hypothetical protein
MKIRCILFFIWDITHLLLLLEVFRFFLDLSFEVHEKLKNISDDLVFSSNDDLLDLVYHLCAEFLQFSLDDAPIEVDP